MKKWVADWVVVVLVFVTVYLVLQWLSRGLGIDDEEWAWWRGREYPIDAEAAAAAAQEEVPDEE
jgi:hypothetical protein